MSVFGWLPSSSSPHPLAPDLVRHKITGLMALGFTFFGTSSE